VSDPLTVIALDEKGAVLAAATLVPNTTWRHAGAAWILELPQRLPPPPERTVVRLCVWSEALE
jgi:hypothetical protein